MKTVLFCGGLGTRIRDVSETIPKPMIPIGDKPNSCHLMHYYSEFGHKDFGLCLGCKAKIVKDFFLNFRPQAYVDCVTGFGGKVELLGDPQENWRIAMAMIDTGIWRNIGERPWAVREHVAGEAMFYANYCDGLCDVAVRPSFSLHLVEMPPSGKVQRICPSQQANLWINGGFFIFHSAIFDYMRPGEELVEAPFQRLIEADQLMAFRHEGFWRPMDTLKDKQVLEDLVEKGVMPWHLNGAPRFSVGGVQRKIQ
jgi:glucose-1-phosphate cytidylyltransferase